jgi:hypothetical protein
LDKAPSGIDGFDQITGGGLPRAVIVDPISSLMSGENHGEVKS